MKNTLNKGNEAMPLPVTRMNAAQKEAAVALYGIENLMQGYDKQFRALAQRVPHGWRDFRLALMTISKLISRILDTVPADQMRAMVNQMAISDIKVVTKSATRQREDDWVVSRDELATLMNYAVEGACLMCDDPNGYSCPLRKLMDELPVNADGRASAVIGCMMRGGGR